MDWTVDSLMDVFASSAKIWPWRRVVRLTLIIWDTGEVTLLALPRQPMVADLVEVFLNQMGPTILALAMRGWEGLEKVLHWIMLVKLMAVKQNQRNPDPEGLLTIGWVNPIPVAVVAEQYGWRSALWHRWMV